MEVEMRYVEVDEAGWRGGWWWMELGGGGCTV